MGKQTRQNSRQVFYQYAGVPNLPYLLFLDVSIFPPRISPKYCRIARLRTESVVSLGSRLRFEARLVGAVDYTWTHQTGKFHSSIVYIQKILSSCLQCFLPKFFFLLWNFTVSTIRNIPSDIAKVWSHCQKFLNFALTESPDFGNNTGDVPVSTI